MSIMLLGAGALATGCGGVLDDLVEACVDFDGPEFETAHLPAARTGQHYNTAITASIVREPYDDAFDYSFSVSGTLPPGLQAIQSGFERHLQIVGIPTAAGTYAFTVDVSVTDPTLIGQTPYLCWTTESRLFQISVASASSAVADTQ